MTRSSWQRPQGRGNRASGSNNQNKDGGRQQAVSSVAGNAWKGKGAPSAQPQAQSQSNPAELHAPAKDFNASEVKEFLKKSKRAARLGWPREATGVVVAPMNVLHSMR